MSCVYPELPKHNNNNNNYVEGDIPTSKYTFYAPFVVTSIVSDMYLSCVKNVPPPSEREGKTRSNNEGLLEWRDRPKIVG